MSNFAFKKKPSLKPTLNQGRKRVDMSSLNHSRANSIQGRGLARVDSQTSAFETDEDEEKQTFQISVSIGGEKKMIQAFIDS